MGESGSFLGSRARMSHSCFDRAVPDPAGIHSHSGGRAAELEWRDGASRIRAPGCGHRTNHRESASESSPNPAEAWARRTRPVSCPSDRHFNLRKFPGILHPQKFAIHSALGKPVSSIMTNAANLKILNWSASNV